MDSSSMFKAALIAGIASGVAVSLPGLDVVNTCTCCSLVIAGGFLAAFLYSRECRVANRQFRAGDGALVGLLTAVVFGVTSGIMGTLVFLAIGNPVALKMMDAMSTNPSMPPEAMDMIDDAREMLEERTFSLFSFVVQMFQGLVLGAVFCTIGGLIGGAVFKVEPAPVEPPSAMPPPPPPPGTPGL